MEAPAETVGTARNKRRAHVRIDKRYIHGKRVQQLVDVFRERLGPDADDPITAAAITRAAETTALSEHLRARMLRGENVSADDVLRASRTADLLTRRLDLHRHTKPPGPTLSAYLAQRGGTP